MTILKPDGSTLVSDTCMISSGGYIDARTLSPAGTYTILVNPGGAATGSLTFTLFDVPADFAGTIVAGGPGVTVPISKPGQNATLTFMATDQQRISLAMTGGPLGGLGTCNTVKILKPDGSPLVSNTCIISSGGYIDTQPPLPAGQYTIVLDPGGTATGSLTFTLYSVPADFTDTLTLNDVNPRLVTISTPGQNAVLNFNVGVAQSVTLHITGSAFTVSPCVTVTLKQGTTELLSLGRCDVAFDLNSPSLPPGAYTIFIDPGGWLTGSLSIKVGSQ